MADNDRGQPQGQLSGLIDQAKSGALGVRMDLERFVYVDRDCEFFKKQIRAVQRLMLLVSQQDHWGLGEHYVPENGRDLVSAKTMVARWREKSRGTPNSFYEILESHYNTVDDFQTLFRTIRERMTAQDQASAARYKQLEATLPQQAPPPQKMLGALGLHFEGRK
ncbi:MAG: hypothetical protein J2P18_11025 [Nocardia sp.]|nr:hypothetical protein [Nocardia sp.]